MFTKKTSIIIPTKDRKDEINNILLHLIDLKIKFNEIIIVDSSRLKNNLSQYKKKLPIKVFYSKPSTSIQRNIGLKNLNKNSKFVMFLDDDIRFDKKAFFKMNQAINKYINYSAFGFNLIEKNKKYFLEKYKFSKIFEILGLYSKKKGKVSQSGWHTKNTNFTRDADVDWISTQASLYKRNYIKGLFFDKNLGEYSYLEDLDFSLSIGSKCKIKIIHKSKYFHNLFIERNSFLFGKKEILNRFYIVKKHNLVIYKFFIMCIIKLLYDFCLIFKGDFKKIIKILGNIFGIIICLINV